VTRFELLQLLVLVSVLVKLVDSIDDRLSRSIVREALEEGTELGPRFPDFRIVEEGRPLIVALVDIVASIALVALEDAEEEVDGLLVIAMSLLLNNHLF
jgi:hypothetical protein